MTRVSHWSAIRWKQIERFHKEALSETALTALGASKVIACTLPKVGMKTPHSGPCSATGPSADSTEALSLSVSGGSIETLLNYFLVDLAILGGDESTDQVQGDEEELFTTLMQTQGNEEELFTTLMQTVLQSQHVGPNDEVSIGESVELLDIESELVNLVEEWIDIYIKINIVKLRLFALLIG